jgi:hypothetical protein
VKSIWLRVHLTPPWHDWQFACAKRALPWDTSWPLSGEIRCPDAKSDEGGDGVKVGAAPGVCRSFRRACHAGSRRRHIQKQVENAWVPRTIRLGNQTLTARNGTDIQFKILYLVSHGRPVEGALVVRRERGTAEGIQNTCRWLRVGKGALHRNCLSWSIWKHPCNTVR